MKASLTVSALRNAIALRDPVGTIVHSDRGSQFRSKKFVRVLKGHGLIGLMGRVGACGDNAAMALFFSLLQKEHAEHSAVANPRRTTSRDGDLDRDRVRRKRRQGGLGKLTPVEFETIYLYGHYAA